MRYRCGDFVIDDERRLLTSADGGAVAIAPRLFDALLFFVTNAGRLLEKDELLTALWPGLVVEENSLNQTVSALRRLLGDEAQASRYIQTVPRRGFRFVAAVGAVVVSADAPSVPTEAPAEPEAPTRPGPTPPDPTSFATMPVPPPSVASAPEETSDGADASMRSARRRWLVGGSVGGATLLVSGGVAAWWTRRDSRSNEAPPTTLAVLPFRPLVAEAGDELLEMGMADSLITRLSSLPRVAVRSVGSVRRFAGPDQDPIAAARLLEVEWVLDGSIQRWGDQVRVTARLIDTRAGEAAWSGNFDERFTGVFNLQDAISDRVAAVLAPHLQAKERKRLEGAGGTRNIDAYQFFLAARQQAQSVRSAALAKSVELFEKAIAIDPAYALAHVGVAESYRRMIFGSDGEPHVVFPASERAIAHAMAIDPNLAETHASLGWQHFWYDWDWRGAEVDFRRAIALNASEANAHFGHGQLLDAVGHDAESNAEMRIARELDPLSLITLTLEAGAVFRSKDRVEGRRRLERVLDIDASFWVAHLTLGGMLIAEQKIDEGIESLERAERLSDGSSQPAMSLGYVLARNGRAERARAIASRLVDTARTRYVPPTAYGLIYAGLGETGKALDALEKALEVRDTRLTLMRQDGRWIRSVGDEARYRAVIARLKFP